MDSDEISENILTMSKKICEFSRLREKELEAAIKDYRSLYTSLHRKNRIFDEHFSKYDFFIDIVD